MYGRLWIAALAFGMLIAAGCQKEADQAKNRTQPIGTPVDFEARYQANLDKLAEDDRGPAAAQKFCVVQSKNRLGSMGTPVKMRVLNQDVFLCCESCRKAARKDPEATVTRAGDLVLQSSLAKLSPEDRKLAEAQKFCAVMEGNRLGSRGAPVQLMIQGEPVFLCCKDCEKDAARDEARTLAKAKKLRAP